MTEPLTIDATIRVAHAELAKNQAGMVAGYIPMLAQADPEQWGVAF